MNYYNKFLSKPDKYKIQRFIDSQYKNSFISLFRETMILYVRKGKHFYQGNLLYTFDIASVEIDEEKLRGKGKFTLLLNYLEPKFDVLVECIQNKNLYSSLLKRGYSNIDNDKDVQQSVFARVNTGYGIPLSPAEQLKEYSLSPTVIRINQ